MSLLRQTGTLLAPERGVTVRMYRQGLGDCFLLAFRADDGSARYLLIDCGVLRSTENEKATMNRVMENIRDATGGHLDILVATHEHYDHLCGFSHAREVFEQIGVGEVWLAWTEDPDHLFAKQLREHKQRTLQGLQAAATRLENSPDAATSRSLWSLSQFFEAANALGANLSANLSATSHTKAALQIVRERVEKPRYCRPGQEPLRVPGVEGVRIYVLGPPENDWIKKSDPTKRGKEVYDLAPAPAERALFQAAQNGHKKDDALSLEEIEARDLHFPFERGHQLRFEAVAPNRDAKTEFFHRHYFGPAAKPAETLEKDAKIAARDDFSWRRIDEDWLGAAGQFALKLDSDTNNTSLALAIELEDGQVLLFPADAQVGNWMSWESVSWPARTPEEPPISSLDLLRRTVLYKVGHHASHNATLRAKGLEMMQSPDLVALIPVDETVARNQGKNGWDMPFPPLLQRLNEKTKGRIIRSDGGRPKEKPDVLSDTQWQDFVAKTRETALFVEFDVV